MGIADQQMKDGKTRQAGAWAWSLLLGLSIEWLALAIVGFSHILVGMFWFIWLALFGGSIAVSWGIMTLFELYARFRARPSRLELSTRRLKTWISIPLIGCVGLWLFYSDLDLKLRLKMSSDALTTRAQEILDSGSMEPVMINDRIGLFSVHYAAPREDGTVSFAMQYSWIFTETGFIYDPQQVVQIGTDWQTETRRIDQTWVSFIWSD